MLKLWDPYNEADIDIDLDSAFSGVKSLEDIEEESFLSYVEDNLSFYDEPISIIVEDMLDCSIDFQGQTSVAQVDQEIFGSALSSIEKNGVDFYLQYCDETGKCLQQKSISLTPLFLSHIEDIQSDCTFFSYACPAIEAGIDDFVRSSRWHYGLQDSSDKIIENFQQLSNVEVSANGEIKSIDSGEIFTPIVWYGPDNQLPSDRWIIWQKGMDTVDPFWFYSDSFDTIEELVTDAEDIFETWFFAEIGCCCPAIFDITDDCEIVFQEGDDNSACLDKVNEYYQHIIASLY